MKKMVGCCPYCKKAIGLEVEVSGVNIKEKKVNQKTYEFVKSSINEKEVKI
ncbi:hypothetical protein LCGC14_0729870 [marine sediment metagenome]|uniref:Uncharacterized protein n=1 Tax=marine sediment metagenome TaxID=412755 RepID=A0A0F9SV69_9ZZZZ